MPHPQWSQEGGGGAGVAVTFQFHHLHLASFQTHRRVVAGLLAHGADWWSPPGPVLPSAPTWPRRSASARKWASSAKNILVPVRRAAAAEQHMYSLTKASRRTGSALTNRFLGRFSDKPQPVQVFQATAPAQRQPKAVLLQTGAPPSSSSWIGRCPLATAIPAPPPSTRLAALRSTRGGTSRLLKSQRLTDRPP